MLFVAALLPVVLYLTCTYWVDRLSLVRVWTVVKMLGCGMVAAAVCYLLFRLPLFSNTPSNIVHPVVEEVVKALPLLVMASRKRIVFFIDSTICGAAVGAGFALTENVFYLLLADNIEMGTALFRGLEVSLMHIGISAAIATALMLLVRLYERHRSRLASKTIDVIMPMITIAAAVALHIAHNAFQLNPLVQTTVVLGGMTMLLLLIYQWDMQQIGRWIDRGLNRQLELMHQTRAGQWGAATDEVGRYVELHTRLTIAAKGRLMAHEVGLDYPLDAEYKSTLLADYEQYKKLWQQLSATAKWSLRPLLKFYPADHKALADLMADCRR